MSFYIKAKKVSNYDECEIGNIIPEFSPKYRNYLEKNGFLRCDGSQLSREYYHELFKVIGFIYGDGDGRETFNIPDSENYQCNFSDSKTEKEKIKELIDEILDDMQEIYRLLWEHRLTSKKDSGKHAEENNINMYVNYQINNEVNELISRYKRIK